MLKNKIFRRIALLVSLIMLLTSTVNTTFGFIVTKTDSLFNTFVPFDSIINNLLISKKIEHPFGDEYVIPDSIAFDFKVDFGPLYGNTTIGTSAGDVIADENGAVIVSVRPDKTFTVFGIDVGTRVIVTEVQKEDSGFNVKDGAVTREGVVAEDGSLKFEYVNKYTPASVSPANVYVKGRKVLEGREWRAGDEFSFKLEQKQADGEWILLGSETVVYDKTNPDFDRFDFTSLIQSLTFEKVGVYSFRMTESAGKLEDVDYDKSVNTFDIRVTDVDMDGKLEINSVTASQNAAVKESDGKYTVDVTFNNTYVPRPEDITVDIQVKKTVKNTGASSISPAGFEFVLRNTEGGEMLTAVSDERGDAVFSVTFTADDIGKAYSYKLYEIDTDIPGVTYDAKSYDISIEVAADEDNKLIEKITVNGEKTDEAVAAFENIFHTELAKPEDVSVVIVADKTVDNIGEAKIGPEGFEFLLENAANGEKQISVSDANGEAPFKLTFTDADIGKTYQYKLSEVNTGAVGVTYDDKVHDITVSVTLSEDNKLIPAVTVNGNATENPVAEFVNTYQAQIADAPQTEDNSHMDFWLVMMFVSGTACVLLAVVDKKYSKLNSAR